MSNANDKEIYLYDGQGMRSASVQIGSEASTNDGSAAKGDEVTDLGAIPRTDGGTAAPNLGQIPSTEVKPEDMGMLSLRYVDGVPQLVVSGGTALPAILTVVDASGKAVGAYTAGPVARARALAMKGGGELLEPIMAVEVVTPEDYMGDVMADLNRR